MKFLRTGASSGIGLACTNHYSSHEITAIDKENVDLSNPSMVKKFIEGLSDFDALIYCAGMREIEKPHLLSYPVWEDIINVNLTSSFLISQCLIKKALASNKPLNIVNIASVSGLQAEPDRAAYVTSKYALIGLTKQLAYQYGKNRIRVNAIAPGIIKTPLTNNYFQDHRFISRIKSAIPVGHWGQVEHVLSLIDVCLSNDYINGAVLVCDGGWTIGRSL